MTDTSPLSAPAEPAFSLRLRTLAAYVAFALLAVGIVALHTDHFQGRAYRQDEAWIIHGAIERGGAAAMTQWVSTNIHPPLWVIAGNAWVDLLGQHETVTRTLSGLLTLLTLALLFRLGADLAGSPRSLVPLMAVVIVGASTHFQFYMHEFRPYPALVMASVAVCLTFLRWLRRPTFRRALLFVACGIMALYVHFFSVYVLAALALYFVFFVRWRSGLTLRAVGLFVAIGLAYLGWIGPFLYAVLVTNPGGIDYATSTSGAAILSAYRRLSFVPRELFGVLFITAILIPVGRVISPEARVTAGDRQAFGRDTTWRKGFPLFVGLMVFVVAFAVNVVVANVTLRSLTLLLPLAALVAAFGFVALPRAAQLALLLFIVPTAFTFTDNEWPGPQDEVAAHIAPDYEPGSPVIINISYVPRQIAVLYYVQQRMGAPIPHDLIWQVINPNQPYTDFMPYEPAHPMLTGTRDGVDALRAWLDDHPQEQVWYIERYGGASLTGPITEVLNEDYGRVAERSWENEYTVVEFRRK